MLGLLAWSAAKLPLLPSNGLDRSLHLPVMVGLLLMSAFTETLGWTYAGLVVPGYLAAVFVVAPVTGLLVVCEAVLAYLVSALVGRWLPKTNAWSTLFGRERFLLIILTAVLVRLVVEASLLPWAVQRFQLAHSRELYSIGLVLVPLLANGFWNAGLRASLPRIALISGLTYLVIDRVLLEYTNFTVSRFQVANESVSLLFLDTPHAYIILLLGAIFAARDNVRYGWDYSGILVPALLAVACYQPTKLLTTLLEALVVLLTTQLIVRFGPLSRALIVGPRRMVVAYTVGFLIKWLIGAVVLSVAPTVQMVDYFGFGYLLPTLLAVKMWSTDRIGSVLMPTVQVAVTAFLVGNVLALGMRFVSSGELSLGEQRMFAAQTQRPLSLGLMLGDVAPAPQPPAIVRLGPTTAQQTLRIVHQLARGDPRGPAVGGSWEVTTSVRRHPSGWWSIVPRTVDPNDDRMGPRLGVQVPVAPTEPLLVVAQVNQVGAPVLVVAEQVAELLDARAVVVRSRLPAVQPYDDAFLAELRQALAIEQVLLIVQGGTGSELSVAGAVPAGLDVTGLGEVVGAEVELRWRAPGPAEDPYAGALVLRLSETLLQRTASARWSAPELDEWSGSMRSALLERLSDLTEVAAGGYRRPTLEELRLFGRAVFDPWLATDPQGAPSEWLRALAGRLQYQFARLDHGRAWALFEPAGPRRRGNATWIRSAREGGTKGQPGLAIEVPAPRWELGVVDAALATHTALSADAFLLSGSLPSVSPNRSSDVRSVAGTQSFYQHAHEIWIQRGGRVVAIHGISPEQALSEDGVVAFEAPVGSPLDGPEWSRPVVQMWLDHGLTMAAVDGSLSRLPFDGSSNPTMAYSRRFGLDQTMLLWLGRPVRSVLVRGRSDQATAARMARLGPSASGQPVAERALHLARCASGSAGGEACPDRAISPDCELAAVEDQLVEYNQSRNPYALLAALAPAGACHVETMQDPDTSYLWALLAGEGEARLVPLRMAKTLRSQRSVASLEALRRALAVDLAVLRVRVTP